MSAAISYPIYCYAPGCIHLAKYKIASRWSDGSLEELKTYSLSCESCRAKLHESARVKQAQCRLAPGETLEAPEVYDLVAGSRQRPRKSPPPESAT